MTEDYFLWPKSSVFRGIIHAPRFATAKAIEENLKDMFPSGYPVLCSSGRSALVLALIESGLFRSDLVGVFPYASHCVLDAISRVATPLAGPTATTSARLRVVYHQWAYVQETNLPKNCIEDCADTLCTVGTTLFPGGGRFEIWSLPKILGTTSGGVLWCRDEETADRVRSLREDKGGGLCNWILRLLALKYPGVYLYWQGAEASFGRVSCLQTGEILAAVLQWDAVVADRLKKLNMVWPLGVEWLQRQPNRLPPVVPLSRDLLSDSTIQRLGISSGYRMIERVESDNGRSMIKVLPVPIHQEVPVSWLQRIINRLSD